MKIKYMTLSLASVLFFATLCGCSNLANSLQASSSLTISNNTSSNNSTDSNIPHKSEDVSFPTTKEELLEQASVLSEQLILYSVSSNLFIDSTNNKSTIKSDLTITEISDGDIFRFIASIFKYNNNNYHPYIYITETNNINPNDYVLYALENVQTVVSQLFNKNDWFFDEDYDDDEGAYVIPTGVGFGNNVTITDVNSLYLEKNIVQTNLAVSTGGIGEENFKKLGNLLITFDIIEENNKMFLRLLKIESI